VATKDKKREARDLIENLEYRVHSGPPICSNEILSAREFLREHDFSPASDYFSRLGQVQHRLQTRPTELPLPAGKRNYGGEASGRWMQLQCAYDHVILSTCYEGEFNQQRGRVKISHRFNQEGRLDFVELKFLRSLHACLNGEIRKLLTVKRYQDLRKDWHSAEAFVLPVLPREMIFLFEDIFRCSKPEVFTWLINIGHGMVEDLLKGLAASAVNGEHSRSLKNPDQLCLSAVRTDGVAMPILEKAAALECAVELDGGEMGMVRYYRK
jgi:hypothetical protein